MISFRRTFAVWVFLLSVAGVANAQLPVPQLKRVFQLGGQAGTNFELTISGDDLDDARELVFSHPGITAEPIMEPPGAFDLEPQPLANRFVVTVAEDVSPGLYDVRAVGYFGVSNPRVIAVDNLRETVPSHIAIRAEDATPLEVGTAVSARAAAEAVHYYRVDVRAGQKVLVECFAERLDSQMDATLVLYNVAGAELARVRDTVGRDPVLLLDSEEDRQYVVGVYDFTYRGGEDYFYRLAAHDRPRLLYAFPPVVSEGEELHKLTLFGWNLPGAKRAADGLSLDHAPLEQVTVWTALGGKPDVPPATEANAVFAAGIPYQLESARGKTNPVFIGLLPHPVVVEEGKLDSPQEAQAVPVPGEFVGRLEARGDTDWIEFTGNPGDVLHLDVVADRMGVPADVVLAVHKLAFRPDGTSELRPIASVDDRPYGRDRLLDISSTDPAARIIVDEPTIYRVEVRDLYGSPSGDPRLMYRVSVGRDTPDFRLAAFVEPPRGPDNQPLPTGSLSVRRRGAAAMIVYTQRVGGFDGAVEVHAAGLPSNVNCRPAIIGPREDRTTLVLSAEEDAQGWSGPIEIVGRAELADGSVERPAVGATVVWPVPNPNTPPQVRLCDGTWLTVTDAPEAPATLACGDGAAADVVLHTSVGGKITVPVQTVRQEGFTAEINVTPVGLPDGVEFKAMPLTAESSQTEAEVFVAKSDFAAGIYEFHVRSRVQANLPRNPAAIARAEARHTHLDGLLAAKTSEAAGIATMLEEARAAVQSANEQRTAVEASLATARQETEQADAKQDELSRRLEATRQTIATTATVAESARALDAVEQPLRAAIEAARAARAKVIQLEAELATSRAAADIAATRLQVVERELHSVEQAKKQLEDLSSSAAQRLEEVKKANAPRVHEFELISQPVRLIVDEAPLTMSIAAEPLAVAPSAAAKLSVHVERKFGFDGEVVLALRSPKGAAITAEEARIPPGANAAAIEIRVGPDVRPGLHSCEVEASMPFNGVSAKKRMPLNVLVEKATADTGDNG